MKKKILAVCMAAALAAAMCACGGKETAGGLGTLELEQPAASREAVPELNGGANPQTSQPTETPRSTEVPQTPPEQKPAPAGLEYEQYQGKYFSMQKPVGWDVWEYVFNDGTGSYRLIASIYDPNNKNNCVFIMTALEPLFSNETDRSKMAPYLPHPDATVVIDPLNAEGMALQFGAIQYSMAANGFATATGYLPDWMVTKSLLSNVADGSTDSVIASEFLGEATAGGDGKRYAVYYGNTLTKQFYAHLGCNFYISFGNYGVCLEESLCATDLDNLIYLASTYEQSGLNSMNSSFKEENPAEYLPLEPSIDTTGALE